MVGGGGEWEEGALAVPPTTPVTPCPREGVTRAWGSSRGAGGDTSSSRAGSTHWMVEVRAGVGVSTRLGVTRKARELREGTVLVVVVEEVHLC